jgi:hypothetical protein
MKQRIVSAGFPQERAPARSRRSFRGFRTTALVSPPPHAGPVQPPPPQPIAGTGLRAQGGLLRARGQVFCVLMLVAIYCWVPAGADVCTTQKIVSAGPPDPPRWVYQSFGLPLTSPTQVQGNRRATAAAAGTGVCPLGSRRSGRLHEAEDRSAASGPRRWSLPLPTQCLLTQKIAHIPIYANT